MKKRITVFTPTYNRAHLLHSCYESLLRQTESRFKWLVIDDGSTDNTGDLVRKWINEKKIEIEYYYKENGGLHTAYNTAIEHLTTELSVCIDSDDWLPDNAIEIMLDSWDKYKDVGIAGLIGLDYTKDGKIIGDHLTEGEIINPIDLLASKTNSGDKKYVVATKYYKQVAPMPVFANEKFLNPHYLILRLSAHCRFVAVDAPFCIVDYQQDGMSSNMFRQYMDSPRSYAELRRVIMRLPNVPKKYMIKTVIHYCSSSRLCSDRHYIRKSPKPLLTVLCTPVGWLLTAYINKKAGV